MPAAFGIRFQDLEIKRGLRALKELSFHDYIPGGRMGLPVRMPAALPAERGSVCVAVFFSREAFTRSFIVPFGGC